MKERDGNVGHRLGRTLFHALQEERRITVATRKSTHPAGALIILTPLLEAAVQQEVAIVGKELMGTTAGHVHELDFHLGARGTVHATLGDILLGAAGRLYHLVNGAVATCKISRGEMPGDSIEAIGQLVHRQILVASALRQHRVMG